MANEFYGNVSGNGMYGGYGGNPYNAPGASFAYPGVQGYQNNAYNPYNRFIGQQGGNNNAQQQQITTNANWIYVPNIEAANNISIQPNQTLYIMNQNKNEFYLKTANEMGVSSMKVCPFTVFDAEEYKQKSQLEQAQSVAGGFVGVEEYNNFKQAVMNQFAIIQQQGISQQQQTVPVQPAVIAPNPTVAQIETQESITVQPATKKGKKND